MQDKLNAVINEPVSSITENLETLFITIQSNCNEATFGVIYRPPSGNFNSFLNELSIILEHLPKKSVHIMGDFNINLHVDSKNVSDFEEVMFTTGFLPLISTYTHEKPGCNQTCIDNIFSNDLNNFVASGTISDRISHHLPIFHIFDGLSTSKSESNEKYIQYYDYCDSNVRQFITSLYINLDKNPPQNFDQFNNTFKDNLDGACKLRKPKTSKRTPINNPWITSGIVTSITKKHELHDSWSKAKKKKCILNPTKRCYEIKGACHCHFCKDAREKHTLFIEKRRRVKRVITLARRQYTCDKIKECQGDSKKIWELINGIRGKNKKQIKPSFVINKERIICRRIIAHEFNKYFVSIASNLNKVYDQRLDEDPIIANPRSFTDYLPQSCPSSIYLAECTNTEVADIINELENGKASDIPVHVIKKSCYIICDYLAKLYNDCMNEGIFPDQLKTGKITPIYKKENEELIENYRPVSTLPIFGKIFEKIIYSRLYSFFVSKGLIYENQFGFRKGHSTNHALNYSVNHVENNLNKKNHVLGIFIDLSKAFDTLPFDKLLHKLSNYGIRGSALKLLTSYLHNRHQYVSVLGEESEHLLVALGVPQGSVLGPLLFLLYINDICKCSNLGMFILFADDTNIFVSAESKDKAIQKAELVLAAINQYMRCNLLHINIKKCCYMYFSPTKRQSIENEPECSRLQIDGIPIKPVSKTKFLGVILDDQLNWVPHIEQLVKKLQSTCGRLYRIKSCLPENTYDQIYHALFESHLGYGISVWGGVSLNRLEPLFLVQKKCVRIIFGDSEAFADKFRTCSRTRPILCIKLQKGLNDKDSAKPNIKPCTICIGMKKKHEKKVRPHRCQILGEEFYSRESTKPLFKAHDLMTVHNLYRFRCMMEAIKIVRNHVPVSMYTIFQKSNRKEDLFITPQPSHNFAYNSAYLWNQFIAQTNLRGKLNSIGSIKLQLKKSILTAQCDHDILTWYNTNFTKFHAP